MIVQGGLVPIMSKLEASKYDTPDNFAVQLGHGDSVGLFVRSGTSQGLVRTLSVVAAPDKIQTFVATIPKHYSPIMPEPPEHIRLDHFALGAASVEFGPGLPVGGLLLAPSLAHGELYGTDRPPSPSTLACLGTIAVSPDQLGDNPTLVITMPAISYDNFDIVFVGIDRDVPD